MSENNWLWWWGDGAQPEHLHAGVATRAEALADASLQRAPGARVTICEGRRMPLKDDFFNADRVLEWWGEANEELANEDGELHMEPTQSQQVELECALNDLFNSWRVKHGLGRAWPLETRNEQAIELPAVIEVSSGGPA